MLSEWQMECDALDQDIELRVVRLRKNMDEMERILTPRKGNIDAEIVVDQSKQFSPELKSGLHTLDVSRLDTKRAASLTVSETSTSQLPKQWDVSEVIEQYAVQLQQIHDEKEHYKMAYEKLFLKIKAGQKSSTVLQRYL